MGLDIAPTVYNNFVNEDEQHELMEYASYLNDNGHFKALQFGGRDRKCVNINNPFPKSQYPNNELVNRMVKKIEDNYNITNQVIDPFLGFLIGWIQPGGFLHYHNDMYKGIKTFVPGSPYSAAKNEMWPKSMQHNQNVRFNIMVSRGEDKSYDPIIDDKLVEVPKRSGWCFSATKYWHGTKVLVGTEPRIVYQFGFMVTPST